MDRTSFLNDQHSPTQTGEKDSFLDSHICLSAPPHLSWCCQRWLNNESLLCFLVVSVENVLGAQILTFICTVLVTNSLPPHQDGAVRSQGKNQNIQHWLMALRPSVHGLWGLPGVPQDAAFFSGRNVPGEVRVQGLPSYPQHLIRQENPSLRCHRM